MKKVLILASVASMIQQFNDENIKILQKLGHQVYVIANFNNPGNITSEKAEKYYNDLLNREVIVFNVNIKRKPINLQNIIVYREIKKIIQANKFDLIHLHSPIGGVIGRLISKKKQKTNKVKVMYTAHGFHFFRGASILNWLVFYPIERFLARYTDTLITINNEDFQHTSKFKAKKNILIPGVGIDYNKFYHAESKRELYSQEFNIAAESMVILSVGELNDNKNHQVIIKALGILSDRNINYIICGVGNNKDKLMKLAAENGVADQVHLLGFRTDIPEICKISDVFVFPSKREGLGLACIEAMASGLPIITSRASGILEYSENEITGFNNEADDVDGFVNSIKILKENKELRKKMGEFNQNLARRYDKNNVNELMEKIYLETMG